MLSDVGDAEQGVDYEVAGRITMTVLTRFLAFNDYDFYLCGPPALMQDLYDGLRGYHVADERIHAEAFGPAALIRSAAAPPPGRPQRVPAIRPVAVSFLESLKEARWTPESGTLLELAEERGLAPEFSCRSGTCGTCRTRLVQGAVAYLKHPEAPVGEGEVLICCAVPAASERSEDVPLQLAL